MPNPPWLSTTPTMSLIFLVSFINYSVLGKAIDANIRHEVVGLSATARYHEFMATRAQWPRLGVQPQDLNEHATQVIAEATDLLILEKG